MSVENTHYGAVAIAEALRNCRSIFFIGIGGISMSALAELSAHNGLTVGGSDRTKTAVTEALEAQGIRVDYGHDASHVENYDAVVYTVAIDAQNPEYVAAKQAGKPLFSRADYLGYLMTGFGACVGVAGMHGKSTCTAMCASIFLAAGDPTVLCGASLPSLGNSPCRIGRAREHIVFEACEYMDSFLDFNPTLAVILNIGMDHVDYFHSMKQIRTSFLRYAERTGKDGTALYNADDAESVTALAPFAGKKVTFALDAPADFTAKNICRELGETAFDFCRRGEVLCRVRMRTVGKHNLYNALAAASAATLCGIVPEKVADGLASFRGANRRMEYKGELPSGAVIYDDYGHHPDEIKATLAGAKELGFARVLCAYQPHTYSRTAGLLEEFSRAFGDADRVYFADIYAAREENIYGVTSKTLADRIGEKATYCGSFDAVAETIKKEARNGDLVIVMGAGDIYQVFDRLEL
ncbi:MAG: UDP-N-acetylmuramate--L-alanine ligase [Clostridia bacterium]|nr:UDP-N-acetylmuramate--L-alanine ligase [Clostridia bacterium]